MKWRPIDTAPKQDPGELQGIGPDILLWDGMTTPEGHPDMFIGWWERNRWALLSNEEHWHWTPEPTHWMPLPDPPESAE